MDMNFTSLEELYKRLYPALTTKKREIVRAGYSYIKQKDIWEYLKEIKWSKSEGLTLSEMVDDILHLDNEQIVKFLKHKLEERQEINE